MLKTMRLLYAEDDEDVRWLMVQRFRRLFGEVIVAENGRQGLKLYEELHPDMVVSDVQMPGMNGLDMAAAIKAIDHNTPVILTTAFGDADFLLEAIEIGIDGYVMKPFSSERLVGTLTKCAGTLYYRREFERKNQEIANFLEGEQDDLRVANTILHHIMRTSRLCDPQIRRFQRPARQFSGDFIATERNGNGDLYVMLADVTGHGLQAALFLLPISRVFYSMVKKNFLIPDIVAEINQTMREIAPVGRFAAVVMARIPHDLSFVEIWNGGIPTALYVDVSGEVHEFRSRYLPMGVVGRDDFCAETETLEHPLPGVLLLCSDGLVEAENAGGEPFGDERIQNVVKSGPPDKLFDRLLADLDAHLGGGATQDDLMVALVQCGI